ncbi:MAG: helix-turn-helix domain-containing protein [Lachnospiraceae bacterium]
MSFGENLQFLRKRSNITQEQLAESLNVSRQSVSKWESDGSFPETEKLLQLCDMFSCDLDTLMRGNAEESLAEDTAHYDAHMNNRSRWIAGGVGLILFGLGLCSMLTGFGVAEEISSFFFLLSVAAAVAIFIIKGMQHESFQKRYPHIRQFYSEEELYQFEKRFPLLVAIPVVGILLDVACYMPLETLIAGMGYGDDLCGGIFLWVLAAAVSVLVYGGMQKEKYNIKAYNKESSMDKEDIVQREKIGKWCGVIMLIATALFLLSIGIAGMDFMQAKDAGMDYSWRSSIVAFSWVVFPIGGILCGVVSVIFTKTNKE